MASFLAPASSARSLSLLTWNVWFDPFEARRRYHEILSTSVKSNCDVICFQEIIPEFIEQLKQDFPSLLSSYDISDDGLDGRSVLPYGNLILCKSELRAEFQFHGFPSNMDRRLLTASFTKGETTVKVGTVHLESLSYHKLREQQIQVCNDVLKDCNLSVLCGDFNFCSYRNYRGGGPLENDSLAKFLPGYKDVWTDLKGGSEEGYTFDTTSNGMLRDHRSEQMRYDRVCYRDWGNTAPDHEAGWLSKVQQYIQTTKPTSTNSATEGWVADTITLLNRPLTEKLSSDGVELQRDAEDAEKDKSQTEKERKIQFHSPDAKSKAYSGANEDEAGTPQPLWMRRGVNEKTVMVLSGRGCVPLFPSDHYGLHATFAPAERVII